MLIASTEPGSFADDIGLAEGRHHRGTEPPAGQQPGGYPPDSGYSETGRSGGFPGDAAGAGPRGGGEWQSLFVAGTVPARTSKPRFNPYNAEGAVNAPFLFDEKRAFLFLD